MVLEEATATPDSFSSDTAPSSDADPYYGDQNSTELATRDPRYVSVKVGDSLHVKVGELPRHWVILGAPTDVPQLVDTFKRSCSQAQQALGRPVTQEEADALAFHFSKTLRVASYGSPVGIAAGSVLAFRGRAKYRFPGYTPGAKFNPDKFLVFKGSPARLMWNLVRVNLYIFGGAALGQFFFGSYAMAVGSAGRVLDPRLKNLMDALQQQAKSGSLPGNRQVDQTAGKREGETFDMARQRQKVQETWRKNNAQRQEPGSAKTDSSDDVSPTGGAFGSEFVDLGSAAVSDTTMMSDDQARRQSEGIQRQQEASYAKSLEPQQSHAASKQRQEPTRDAFSSEEDSRPANSGSAWDRLRQHAISGKPSAQTSRSVSGRETSSSSDSFASLSSDEDKQLAKAEAQKEFDSRIDRERSGKDFEDKKRW